MAARKKTGKTGKVKRPGGERPIEEYAHEGKQRDADTWERAS